METFKRLKGYYMPYKHYFIWSILSLLIVTTVTVAYPLILQFSIDEVILTEQFELIPYVALFFILMMGLKAIFLYVHQYFGDLFGVTAVYELRNDLYKKLQYLPYRFYDNARTGDLMSRLAQDVEAFRFFLSFGGAQVLNFICLLTFGFAVMLYLHVQLALITLLAIPFLSFVVYRFDKNVHPAFRNIRKSLARLTTKVQENVSGVNTVKALSQEDKEIERFMANNENYRENHIHTAGIWAKFFPVMEVIGNFCVVALLAYGGWLVIEGQMMPGELVAFFSLVWFIIGPLMNLGFILNTFSQSKAAGERLLEIMDEPEDIRNKDDALVVHDRLDGHVQFIHVTHQYEGEEDEAIKDLSLDAPPGTVIGLVGATGSGKTTITQLISRFYEPKKGEIFIDGHPIENYDLQSLRSNIGVVSQDPFLFSSSIRDNIAYGNPNASLSEVIEAAKRADAHEFIEELPEGYDTILGERGGGLSGGQKQRISIARALLINPSILVMDDATSAVDMETEIKIQKAMREVMHGRTTFVIAHRVSSVQEADEIIVLDEGHVIERGTHNELLRNPEGAYRKIYDIQFADRNQVMQHQAM